MHALFCQIHYKQEKYNLKGDFINLCITCFSNSSMARLLVWCSCCFIFSSSKILFSNFFCTSSDSFTWISRGPRDYKETENEGKL